MTGRYKSTKNLKNKHSQTGPGCAKFFAVFSHFKPDFNPALGQIWLKTQKNEPVNRACKSQIAINPRLKAAIYYICSLIFTNYYMYVHFIFLH